MNPEGGESIHVLDTGKLVCPTCGGVEIMLTKLMDDPNDITDDKVFAALKLSNGDGSKIQGLVGLCAQCGKEWVPLWYTFDTCTFTGAELTPALTNLDAAVANGLAGCWFIALVGTDANKYVAIVSNTLAAPTVITLAFTMTDDTDGLCMITNIEPVGLTKITA